MGQQTVLDKSTILLPMSEDPDLLMGTPIIAAHGLFPGQTEAQSASERLTSQGLWVYGPVEGLFLFRRLVSLQNQPKAGPSSHVHQSI